MKNEIGNTILTTPIIIALGMIIISILIVFTINIMTPYIWYEKLSSTCLKYIFIMEEYGYLSKTEKNNLIKELYNNGFNKNDLEISCTSSEQEYGEEIYLEVEYEYELKLPNTSKKIIPMKIHRESVSKR
jgi:hypothetical protein